MLTGNSQGIFTSKILDIALLKDHTVIFDVGVDIAAPTPHTKFNTEHREAFIHLTLPSVHLYCGFITSNEAIKITGNKIYSFTSHVPRLASDFTPEANSLSKQFLFQLSAINGKT